MRVTKTSAKVQYLRNVQKAANIGCGQCPCCGESKKSTEWFAVGEINKGVLSGIEKTWVEGLFRTKFMKCDCYFCLTCGAEWESGPYEWQ